jgi:hypothetical protein
MSKTKKALMEEGFEWAERVAAHMDILANPPQMRFARGEEALPPRAEALMRRSEEEWAIFEKYRRLREECTGSEVLKESLKALALAHARMAVEYQVEAGLGTTTETPPLLPLREYTAPTKRTT